MDLIALRIVDIHVDHSTGVRQGKADRFGDLGGNRLGVGVGTVADDDVDGRTLVHLSALVHRLEAHLALGVIIAVLVLHTSNIQALAGQHLSGHILRLSQQSWHIHLLCLLAQADHQNHSISVREDRVLLRNGRNHVILLDLIAILRSGAEVDVQGHTVFFGQRL